MKKPKFILSANICSKAYRQNPVILWEHDAQKKPLGKMLFKHPQRPGQPQKMVARLNDNVRNDRMRKYLARGIVKFQPGFLMVNGQPVLTEISLVMGDGPKKKKEPESKPYPRQRKRLTRAQTREREGRAYRSSKEVKS